ncbi:hypothetical protein [Amycolatopsis keratiniphila]|uniref:hypothetical protein n=1 Tax=Amycolatopsis keratiniphila TaxID=129921 RepID=UPI0003A6981A|nr:hypothetical protein [Amycolatopsis keratiniphila]
MGKLPSGIEHSQILATREARSHEFVTAHDRGRHRDPFVPASRLDRWNLGAPVVMVTAGVVIGLVNESSIAIALNTEAIASLCCWCRC